ncbi:MAG: TonB-dependent receptor [Deltaproteobacteria bacterium]|nr:TonB-dependent receptor [Deltaproteobacteria bacterium]
MQGNLFRFYFKTIVVLACGLGVVWPGARCRAQSAEELAGLALYFDETELVVSATRAPMPVSRSAENITVITARQIRDMNAHSVAEVLNRVLGISVAFSREFGASSLLHIQGAEPRHVTVMVDGMPLNYLSGATAETNLVPPGIIERIEVVKGPASSVWGSSLGGVVNIITKSPGDTDRPEGSISASLGRSHSRDYRAEVTGRAGSLGYYLFAGRRDSEGLRSSRSFDTNDLYARFSLPLSDATTLGFSLGYSRPHTGLGDFPRGDLTSAVVDRMLFATTTLDTTLTEQLSLHINSYVSRREFVQRNDSLGLGMNGPEGVRYLDQAYDETMLGGSARLVWRYRYHTLVTGFDYEYGDLEQIIHAGPVLQRRGLQPRVDTHPDETEWALYINDTITVGRWSIIPGVRYDHNSITGSFVSPSLGIVCDVAHGTTVRVTLSRGFASPPLSYLSGGGLFMTPNRSLDREEVWSYQAGIETSAIALLRLKATVFYHELDDEIQLVRIGPGPQTLNQLPVNSGEIRRQGVEVEGETEPFHNVSLWGGFAWTHIQPKNDSGSNDWYGYTLGLKYDDEQTMTVQLLGHYAWWDASAQSGASYNDFIWDLHLQRKIYERRVLGAELFFSLHNMFNGRQFSNGMSKNPSRWLEAGVRFSF